MVIKNCYQMINNINFRMKRILYIFLSLQFIVVLNSSAFAEAAVAQSPTVILSGVLDGDRGSIKVIKELRRSNSKLQYEDYSNYRLSADVSFKTLKQKTLFDELQFNTDEDLRSGKEYTRLLFSGKNDAGHNNAIVELLPDLQSSQSSYPSRQSATLASYDELWVDYRDIIDDNPAQIGFSLLLESEVKSDSTHEKLYYNIVSEKHPIYTLTEVEDISKAAWQPKDKFFLFKRTFGLEGDSNWRYTQDGDAVVLQRRFDRTLSSGAIDLVLDADTKLEWLNLRLKTEDGDKIVVEWSSIPKQISRDDDGSLRVRILSSELQRRLHKQLVLEEMIIFLSGIVDEILENRPKLSIHWMDIKNVKENKDSISEDTRMGQDLKAKVSDKENLRVIPVPTQIEETHDGNERLKISLAKVLGQVDWNTKVVSMKLSFEPKLKNKLGGVEIKKVSLVSTYENKAPAIVLQGREILKRWGVELDSFAHNDELSVWPVIYKHSNTQLKPTNIDPQGRWIDLEWKVGKEIIKGSYLYLGGKEIQDKVVGIQATPYSFSGESLGNWFLKLNESVQLDNFKGSLKGVDYIKIRVYIDPLSGKAKHTEIEDTDTPKGNRSPITELALFGVDSLSFDKMLDAPLPLKQETSLDLKIENKPSNIITNKAQDGTTTFYKLDDEPSHGDLFFNTVINNNNRSEEDSLVVSYEGPWIFPLIDECWLEMTAIGDGKEIQNKICLDGSSDKKIVPLPGWVDKIKWRAALPYENNIWSNSDRDRFSLSIKLFTTTTTTRDQLVNQPILALDSNKLLPVDAKFNNHRGNFYFDLGDTDSSFFIGNIKHLEHPWLEVDKIILERVQPISMDEWQALTRGGVVKGEGKSFWLQLLKYSTIILAIWWLIFKGWLGKTFIVLKFLFLSFWNLPHRALSFFNIEVSWIIAFWLWSIVTLSLYAGGVLLSGMQTENYYFTFGGMTVVLTWRAFTEYLRPILESRWPWLSYKVYSRSGTKYFSGFIVVLAGVAGMLVLRLEPIAEQLALIGYYMLIAGVVLEILDLRKDKPNNNQENTAEK